MKLALQKEKTDLIVILGDISYEPYHFYGLNGDQYVDMMRDVFTRQPVLVVAGNHDTMSFGVLLLYRFRSSVVKSAIDLNQYYLKIGPIVIFFFNFDLFFYGANPTFDLMKTHIGEALAFFKDAKDAIKIFMSHRPFYCLNKFLNDRCNYFDMMVLIE